MQIFIDYACILNMFTRQTIIILPDHLHGNNRTRRRAINAIDDNEISRAQSARTQVFFSVFCVLLMILRSLYCKVTWCQSTILVAPRVIRQCEDMLLIYEDLHPTTHTTQARSSTDPHTTHPTSILIFFVAIIFLNLYAYLYIYIQRNTFLKFQMVYVTGATQTRTCNTDNQ